MITKSETPEYLSETLREIADLIQKNTTTKGMKSLKTEALFSSILKANIYLRSNMPLCERINQSCSLCLKACQTITKHVELLDAVNGNSNIR